MNKKRFFVAMLFLCTTLVLLGWLIYSRWVGGVTASWFDWTLGVGSVVIAAMIAHHEFVKKPRRHRDEVEERK